MTVSFPNDTENVVSMERFDGMLTSVECTQQGMTLGFEDDSSFAYAQKVWDWVNGADNHTFVMVTGRNDCGDNTHRIPYNVSSIAYDEGRNIARLTARQGTWEELMHSYRLRVGKVPMPNDLGLHRRDWTKDISMDLAANFPFKTKVKTGAFSGELVCNPCHTEGKMNFEFVIETKWKVPTDLSFKAAPQGFKAQAGIRLNFASDLNSKKDLFKMSVAKIPLSGITIPPNILTLGPVLDVQVGGEFTPFEGAVSILTGATATLPDSAVLQADLLDPSNNQFSGWKPDIAAEDVTMQVRVTTAFKLFLEPALKIQAQALGKVSTCSVV